MLGPSFNILANLEHNLMVQRLGSLQEELLRRIDAGDEDLDELQEKAFELRNRLCKGTNHILVSEHHNNKPHRPTATANISAQRVGCAIPYSHPEFPQIGQRTSWPQQCFVVPARRRLEDAQPYG